MADSSAAASFWVARGRSLCTLPHTATASRVRRHCSVAPDRARRPGSPARCTACFVEPPVARGTAPWSTTPTPGVLRPASTLQSTASRYHRGMGVGATNPQSDSRPRPPCCRDAFPQVGSREELDTMASTRMAYFVARAIGSPTDCQCRLPLHSGRCRPRQLRPLKVDSARSRASLQQCLTAGELARATLPRPRSS
jgi:hypothetical protein